MDVKNILESKLTMGNEELYEADEKKQSDS